MKALLLCVILLVGCSKEERDRVDVSSYGKLSVNGFSYNVVCIDRVTYLQRSGDGSLSPKYAFNSNTPQTCEVNHD